MNGPLSLTWRHPQKFSGDAEVYEGETLVAMLRGRHWRLPGAVATAGDREWHLANRGWWWTAVTVTAAGTAAPLATLHTTRWGHRGTLRYADGRTYHFSAGHWWSTEYRWQTTDGVELVALRSRRSRFIAPGATVHGEATITPAGLTEPDHLLLVLLGIYQIKVMELGSAAFVPATAPAPAG